MIDLSSRFSDAFAYAAALHARQRRKVGGEPYVAHLMAVAALVLEGGGDEDEAMAALLHDAVEDQGVKAEKGSGTVCAKHPEGRSGKRCLTPFPHPTLEEIRRRFGDRVAEIVLGCSDAMETPKPPWRQRKEAYIARLAGANSSIRLVSAADKLHNARSILRDYRRLGPSLGANFKGGRDGTLWYYRTVAETLKRSGATPLVEELERTVAELESMTRLAGDDPA